DDLDDSLRVIVTVLSTMRLMKCLDESLHIAVTFSIHQDSDIVGLAAVTAVYMEMESTIGPRNILLCQPRIALLLHVLQNTPHSTPGVSVQRNQLRAYEIAADVCQQDPACTQRTRLFRHQHAAYPTLLCHVYSMKGT